MIQQRKYKILFYDFASGSFKEVKVFFIKTVCKNVHTNWSVVCVMKYFLWIIFLFPFSKVLIIHFVRKNNIYHKEHTYESSFKKINKIKLMMCKFYAKYWNTEVLLKGNYLLFNLPYHVFLFTRTHIIVYT